MNTHTFFDLNLRTEAELFKGSDDWRTTVVPYTVDANQAALLLCDVWDDHWCKGAARRVDAMAPRMQAVVAAARDRGLQIIHAPSDTMACYEGVPQRERIRAITPAPLPEPRVLPDPPLPIDDSDGGCDSGEPPWHRAWSRQHPAIVIEEPDVISDSGQEIYSFLQQRGIDHLLIMGVHTNMCVLKRSFTIKQMTRWGVRCLLMRDLTDAMYNPARAPFVSHDEGTALVIQYIERHWCPSFLSSDLAPL